MERLEKALRGESVDSIDFSYDFPEARKSGWTTDTSSTLRNTRGDIIGVIGVVSDITKRKQAEIKIQQDEKRFHLLFEKAPMGYQSLDFNGNFIEVNQQWLDLLGYTRQEVIGKWFGDFLTPGYQDGFRERFPIFKAKGEIHSEFEMVKKDGDIIFIAFEGKIGYGLNGEFQQTHCLLQDITARKYFDIALQESEEKYRTLFERVGDAIFIYDPETFNILEANSATANLYNYTKDELLGMSCLKFSAEVEKSKSTAGRARDEGDARVVYRHHKTKDGKDLFVLLDVYKTEANGKEVMFAVVKNITMQKEAEEEVNKQLSEKTILLQEVHHRMKNNIASIEGLLLMQLGSTNNPQAVTAIQDAVARVQGMRILYQKLLIRSTDYQEISIKEYIESLIDSITSIFPESSKITIKKQIIDFNLNVKVAVSIGIIINELFTNIFKYSFKDRNEGNVFISLDKVENQVKLIIQDDGVGMGVDFNINKPKGFGLSIVKMLTEQLNGRIVIENTDGTRSIITFKL